MRNHFLRASGVPSSGGSGSFSRGFYGGAGTTFTRSGNFFSPGTITSTTASEPNAWVLAYGSQQNFFSLWYNSYMIQSIITSKELTDASVPSGAKFNKFSSYVWGQVGTASTNVPRGMRWNMFHTTATSVTSNEPGYAVKSGESRTLLYQDQAETYFSPLATAQSNRAGGDTTIESMQLEGVTTYDGSTSTTSGSGYLVEIEAGEGDDTSVTPSSDFTWDGSSDIVIEISTAQASYQSPVYVGLYKHRGFKKDHQYRNDGRNDCHYGSTNWNSSNFTLTTGSVGSNTTAYHDAGSESDDWYDITDDGWTFVNGVTGTGTSSVIHGLKLDYTT